MMLADELSLLDEFTRSAAAAKRLHLREIEDDLEQTDNQKRKEKREREEWQTFEKTILATTAQVDEFHTRLDQYDTATVKALMDNEASLSTVTKQLDEMRSRAFVLPDGRRVFKSIDGQHVFDESGGAVGHDTVDPAIIDNRHPTSEAFAAARDSQKHLEQERTELLRYQAKLDQARETMSGDHVKKADLDALDADLKASVPDAVKRQMGEKGPDDAAPGTTLPRQNASRPSGPSP